MSKENIKEGEIKNETNNEIKVDNENKDEDIIENDNGNIDSKSMLKTILNENSSLKNKYTRLYSDFDNFKKRNLLEINKIKKTANSKLILQLLNVIDDFERAIELNEKITKSKSDENLNNITDGFNLIYNKLFKTLTDNGLSKIKVIGETFDPNIHESIAFDENGEKNKITKCVLNGYKLNDIIIRHPKVIIGK